MRKVEPSLMVKKDGMILEKTPSLTVRKDGEVFENLIFKNKR